METWEKKNTFVYVILGDKASTALRLCRTGKREAITMKYSDNKDKMLTSIQLEVNEEVIPKPLEGENQPHQELNEKNQIIKLANYFLTSQGILISRLASGMAEIPQSNIKIFCYGEKENYDVFHYTGNNFIIQLGFCENREPRIYETSNVDISNFHFFHDIKDLFEIVYENLDNNKEARIMVFLVDHGSTINFGTLTYLQIYSMFIFMNPKSLRIFNDSCKSQLLNDYIEMLDDITDRLASAGIESDWEMMELLPIIYLAVIYGNNYVDPFKYVEKALNIIENIGKNVSLMAIDQMIDNINSLPCFTRIIKHSDPTAPISDIFSIIGPPNILIKQGLEKTRIETISDYMILSSVFDAYKNFYEGPIYNEIFRSVFQQNTISLARRLFDSKTGLTLKQLLRNFELVISQKITEIPFLTICDMRRHKDLKVFSSTPRGGHNINFPNIRINDNTKAVVGSPAMSAFIKEVFMQFSDDEISLDRIKQSCFYGHNRDTYIEYPSSITSAKGTWTWLEINEKRSADVSKDRLLTQKESLNIDEIMGRIGYKRLQLSDRDNTRKRFRERNIVPVMNFVPNYDRDSSDDYYDSDDEKLNLKSDSEDEFFDAKIAKIQKMISTTYVWDRDMFNVWLYLFTKRLKKRYGIDFDPNADVQLDDSWFPNFIMTYNKICKFVPVNVIHRDYEALAPKIERLLLDHHSMVHRLTDLIANCFDDADRIVTPMYFPGKKTYMKRELNFS